MQAGGPAVCSRCGAAAFGGTQLVQVRSISLQPAGTDGGFVHAHCSGLFERFLLNGRVDAVLAPSSYVPAVAAKLHRLLAECRPTPAIATPTESLPAARTLNIEKGYAADVCGLGRCGSSCRIGKTRSGSS